MTDIPHHFSDQIFETAVSFLEAAERCIEPRGGPSGDVHALVWPSEHCAVLACELFLKSIFAEQVNVQQADSPVQVVHYKPVAGGHQRFFDKLSGSRIAQLVSNSLKPSEHAVLSDLQQYLTSSRYPYEKNASSYSAEPLNLARKLKREIERCLEPDENGNIPLN